MGRKLASGGFGTVYRATLDDEGQQRPVIVKKATEFGEAEVGALKVCAGGQSGGWCNTGGGWHASARHSGTRKPMASTAQLPSPPTKATRAEASTLCCTMLPLFTLPCCPAPESRPG